MTEIHEFPQDKASAKPRPWTLERIFEEGGSHEEKFRLAAQHFPHMKSSEFMEALDRYGARLKEKEARIRASIAWHNEIDELCAPIWKDHPGKLLGEALQMLAAQGNERAAVFLAEIDGSDARRKAKMVEQAAERDPFWEIVRDETGKMVSLRAKPGAIHDTPQKLLNAYLLSQGISP